MTCIELVNIKYYTACQKPGIQDKVQHQQLTNGKP
jgi:hypothetical protein